MAWRPAHHGYSKLMEPVPRRAARPAARAGPVPGPQRQLLQAVRGRGASPRPRSPGARDNRTCGLRVVGHGHSLRLENRVPGGDVNPYLALAAIIAAGLDGVDEGPPPEEELVGNAYDGRQAERAPDRCARPVDLFADSEIAAQAFGADVVGPLQQHGHRRGSWTPSTRAVTDYERRRFRAAA